MSANIRPAESARLVAMGSAALMQGFDLIGFETWPDADQETLEIVLEEMLRQRQRALLLLEPHLARCNCAALRMVRTEGGRIVMTEIPPLDSPGDYHPLLDDALNIALLGKV